MTSPLNVSSICALPVEGSFICCVSCSMYSSGFPADIVDSFTCQKCLVNLELVGKIRELEDRVRNLIAIRQTENWIDSVCLDNSATSDSASVSPGPTVVSARPKSAAPIQPQGEWVTVRRGSKNPKCSPPAPRSPIRTQNRFSALCSAPVETENKKVLIIGDSIVRNVRIPNYVKPAVHVKCLAGAKISGIEAALDRVADDEVSTLLLHVGTNDIYSQQSEVLKRNFISLCIKAKRKCRNLVVSGPLPRLYRGDVIYSRLHSLHCWLETWCANKSIAFVNNWDDFWERPGFFRRDGLHPNWRGSYVLSQNMAAKLPG
uniref:SGNH hydrolase-type esterase domain-containing protein n=1 Tax=Erpetoichthys calabaricus TaxID=27687 RepID=A0A8C4RHH3_ERPCA